MPGTAVENKIAKSELSHSWKVSKLTASEVTYRFLIGLQ